MYFLWYLLIGLIVGYIASLIVKGSGSGLVSSAGCSADGC